MPKAIAQRASNSGVMATPPESYAKHAAAHADLHGAFGADRFGAIAEKIARFFGTPQYILGQTVVVVVWVLVNAAAVSLRWDPYPFILLNLAFSTQAAYAAPLILLAQNRQDDRDRVALEEDRTRAEQTRADTEFLARELAALRQAIGEVATRDYLRGELERLRDEMPETSGRKRRRTKPKPDASKVRDDATWTDGG
jgi:uncharacterized membrane protein